jgi:hypothetical protein
VEKFDGEIDFQSEEGKGSCFTFTFKLSKMIEDNGYESEESQYIDKSNMVFKWQPMPISRQEVINDSFQIGQESFLNNSEQNEVIQIKYKIEDEHSNFDFQAF